MIFLARDNTQSKVAALRGPAQLAFRFTKPVLAETASNSVNNANNEQSRP
jgi:hypothetical protein